ncbi:MAG: 30S ribosome-binding factor RbfA [Oscillospiraceae bacterium]
MTQRQGGRFRPPCFDYKEEFLWLPIVSVRINEEIQRELSSLIPTVKDPRVTGMISVTAVETTPDLKYAKVHISVLDKSNEAQVLKGLKSASGYLRRELGRTLNLRNTPQLSFVPDDSIDKGAHILSMLRDPNVVKPVNPDNHYGEDQEDEE